MSAHKVTHMYLRASLTGKATWAVLEHQYVGDFLGGSVVKNLPAVQEIQVQSLGREDALKEGTATHSSTLALRIPWT